MKKRCALFIAVVMLFNMLAVSVCNQDAYAKEYHVETQLGEVGSLTLSYEDGGDVGEPAKGIHYVNRKLQYSFSLKDTISDNANVSLRLYRDNQVLVEDTVQLDNPACQGVLEDEGTYRLVLSGTDGEASIPQTQYEFVMDKTEPEISFDKIKNGETFQESRLLEIHSKEANPDYDSYTIQIKMNLNGKESSSQFSWKDVVNALEDRTEEFDTDYYAFESHVKSDGEEVIGIRFKDCKKDADCQVSVTGKDMAGNEAKEKKISFSFDYTAPVVTVSGFEDGKCYSGPVAVKSEIKEHNLKSVKAKMYVTRTLDGAVIWDKKELVLSTQETAVEKIFDEEGDYSIFYDIVDGTGNSALWNKESGEHAALLKDKVFTFSIDKSAPELNISGTKDGAMSKKPITLTFSVKDRFHNFSQYKMTVTRKDRNGKEESYVDSFDEKEWTDKGQGVVSKSVTYDKDGIYEIRFDAKDKASNEATKTIRFSIDRTAPVISKISYSNVDGVIAPIYQKIYSRKDIVVAFKVRDSVTGVEDKNVYVTFGKDGKKYRARKTTAGFYEIIIPKDIHVKSFDGRLTLWAGDLLGNQSRVTSKPIVYSTKHSRILMDCDKDISKWSNENVTFNVKVSDQSSGISQIVYRIDGEEIYKATFAKNTKEFAYELTASKNAATRDGYTVEVEVTNHCGTVTTASKTVYIDKAAPMISLSGIENGKHYSQDMLFTMEVSDVSYDATGVELFIERNLDGVAERIVVPFFTPDSYEDVAKYNVTGDGSYKIYAVATDGAGNKTVSNTLDFVIDKTAPKLSINNVKDKEVLASGVDVSFGCEESNYLQNKVTILVEQVIAGQKKTSQITEFPKKGKKQSISRRFDEDGTYTVTMEAVDVAGNVAEKKTVTFTIDKTKPEIIIDGCNNYELFDKPITLSVRVMEENFLDNEVEISGKCTDADGKTIDVELSPFESTSRESVLSYEAKTDGHYNFVVTVRDHAGNQDSKEIHFTIDRTKPVIQSLDNFDGQYLQEFRLCETMDDLIKDLTVVSYRVLLNGVEYNGTDVVTEEGKYNLSIEVWDELNHLSEKSIEFMIDRTAPKVIFSGVRDGSIVKDHGVVHIVLADEEDEITGIRVNGKTMDASLRELEYKDYGFYEVEVDCRDKAGNTATRTISFTCVNAITLAVLVVAGVALFGILLAVAVIYISRRRRH